MPASKQRSAKSITTAISPSKPAAEKPLRNSSTKEKTIKYEDKSGGQPELIPIFNSIKALMKPYAKGTIKERGERGGLYTLVSEKPVEIEGRKKNELYFAGIMIQKRYVGFYFMPVYGCDEPAKVFHIELLLKGKGCFHIKKNNPETFGYIKDALKVGYDLYKQRRWVQ